MLPEVEAKTAGHTLNKVEVEAVLDSPSDTIVEVEAEKLRNTFVKVKT